MIRRYQKRDFEMLKRWYKERGLGAPQEAALSDAGWVADERVVGFLYVTNSNIALIDGIVSDPHSLPSNRKQSLQQLCSTIVDVAVMMGYTNIIAATSNESIKEICRKMAFQKTSYELFVLKEKTVDAAIGEYSLEV